MPASPDELIDSVSYVASEVKRLEGEIPVATISGKNRLHNLVTFGAGDRENIVDRQEGLQELHENPEFSDIIESGLERFGRTEKRLYSFRKNTEAGINDYLGASWAAKNLLHLCEAAAGHSSEAPSSGFLRRNLQAISNFNSSNLGGLLRGPIYYTPGGLRSKDKLEPYRPRFRFRSSFSGRMAILAAVGLGTPLELGLIPPDVVLIAPYAAVFGFMGHVPLGITGMSAKDTMWNRPTVYNPLRKRMGESSEYESALKAVGNLDVAVALNGLWKTFESNGHPVAMPDIEQSAPFHFQTEMLKNPLLALKKGKKVIPNDLEFGGPDNKLTFLTGPNSGGKSTLFKAVIQSQVLAQIGGVVPAESLTAAIADRIAYHVPMPPDLDDETGRLGFELGRVRHIIDRSTPKSLTLLDDCLDGTTHQERVRILKHVMFTCRYLGGATLFSTHAHELVEDFEKHGVGQFLQVEFKDKEPSYRVIPGVSHTSHALNVAKSYGFREKQVRRQLGRHGIKPEWF